jgi:hypothetical protein
MEQTPFFQEARPTDRPGAHLERRSKLDPNPVSSRSINEAPGTTLLHASMKVCGQTLMPDEAGDLAYLVS